MKLDLTTFKKAVAQLEESMVHYRAYQSAEDPKLAQLEARNNEKSSSN